MKFSTAAVLSFIVATTTRAAVVWDGSFDPFTTAADFDKWSWANQVGTYQWYIHGSGDTSKYLNPGASYKNPAVTRDKTGLKLTVDSTSHWNGQTMMRTELIPQTKANLGQGQMYYHFSIKRESANGPGTSEHQIMFFESHFTELKVGIGSDKSALNWCINGQSKWSTTFTPGVWYNFAYDINFSGNTVGLWASTGSDPLKRVISNQSASTSTNSQDFHVGVLRLGDSAQEDWYLSGVYIESGTLTTSVGSGSTTSSDPAPASDPPASDPATSTPDQSTTAPSGPAVAHYGQCGGSNYSGSTTCDSGLTCTKVNDYYSQCL